jgi:hypothetical protein
VADGFFHEFSGWVVYIAAFLLLFALGWVLDKFGARRKPPRRPGKTAPAKETTATEAARTTNETGDATLAGATAATPAATMSLREGGASGS